MREYRGTHGSRSPFCRGSRSWESLVLQSVLALTVVFLAGCAPSPAPVDPIPPLVIFFVDGARLSQAGADSIWHDTDLGRDADSVRVLKEPEALARYGAEGRPGVVLIYLKKGGDLLNVAETSHYPMIKRAR